MEYISYETARSLIKNGDIVSVLRNNKSSIIAKSISFITRSPVYHVFMCAWMTSDNGEKRLFAVEADPTNRRMVPVSEYLSNDLHVLAIPDNVDFNKFSYTLIERVGKAKYSYGKAIISGFRQYFKLPKIIPTNGEFCSEMVVKLWNLGGFNMDDTEIDPCMLEKLLIEKYNVKYRCWIKANG